MHVDHDEEWQEPPGAYDWQTDEYDPHDHPEPDEGCEFTAFWQDIRQAEKEKTGVSLFWRIDEIYDQYEIVLAIEDYQRSEAERIRHAKGCENALKRLGSLGS